MSDFRPLAQYLGHSGVELFSYHRPAGLANSMVFKKSFFKKTGNTLQPPLAADIGYQHNIDEPTLLRPHTNATGYFFKKNQKKV
jgi:hypothetical protein